MPVGDRALLQAWELSRPERELCRRAAEGRVLDLSAGSWAVDLRIRAQVLIQLLTGDGPPLAATVTAVRLRGAHVVGRLNLGGRTLRCPLELSACHIPRRVALAKAHVLNIDLSGSHLRRGLSARGIHVDHTLNLSAGFRSDAGVDLRLARIDGEVNCSEATFSHPAGLALDARGAVVGDRVTLEASRCTGIVQLSGARIGGTLDCTDAELSDPTDGVALVGEGLVVGGNVFTRRVVCTGEFSLFGAHIAGQLTCTGGTFTHAGGNAFNAEQIVVDSYLFLRRTTVIGTVRLRGARVGADLDCSGAVVDDPRGVAVFGEQLEVATNLLLTGTRFSGTVQLQSARVGGNLDLTEAHCTGTVQLSGARVDGNLDCSDAELTDPTDGVAFDGEGLIVHRNMFTRRIESTGEFSLFGAHIAGQLTCTGGTFTNPTGDAFNAEQIVVDSYLLLRKTTCTGTVRLLGARVRADLDCGRGSTFHREGEFCVLADRLAVRADMSLREVDARGTISMIAARIGGSLHCGGSTLLNPGGLVLDLELADVAEHVTLHPNVLDGWLDLTNAHVTSWDDEQRSWPSRVDLEGFTYSTISAQDTSVRDRLRWLSGTAYVPQPYEQLAESFRRAGNDQDAVAVLIGKQRARRSHVPGWRRGPGRVWSAILRWTIGYGYRPSLAVLPLAVLSLAGTVLFGLAADDPGLLRPAKPGLPEQPEFSGFRYTMDLLLPVVNFRQRDAFIADGWAAWAAFGFTFAGWLLAAVVVVGLTGVFKRD